LESARHVIRITEVKVTAEINTLKHLHISLLVRMEDPYNIVRYVYHRSIFYLIYRVMTDNRNPATFCNQDYVISLQKTYET